jgi:hypothetical protein
MHINNLNWFESFEAILIRSKFKKKLFPAPDQPLENATTRNIFCVISYATTFVFFFGYWKSWLEIPILFQNLRTELVYTFKWTKSVARLWRNQICEWTVYFEKKIIPLPTFLSESNNKIGVNAKHLTMGPSWYMYIL